MGEPYLPILESTRGNVVESIHYGAIAVVDASGRLLAWHGDPKTVTFLRSSAKPFQALPFIENGGDTTFHLTSREIALICASHDGTDEHIEVLKAIQSKVGVQESDLLCGTHPLTHLPTVEAMRQRREGLTPNRHNCSGKHTGMLAHARMRGLPLSDYLNQSHPVQVTILQVFSEMCALPVDRIEIGTDGCSAPNFAVPLQNAARAVAQLCDPRGLSPARSAACRRITQSMMAHPDMVAGLGRFDTRLMEACQGRVIAKGGAEGYQIIGILPGVLGADSPGIGIAFKISDGDSDSRGRTDPNSRARPAVSLEILRQMGVTSEKERAVLADLGPQKKVINWRKIPVGETRPAFTLERA